MGCSGAAYLRLQSHEVRGHQLAVPTGQKDVLSGCKRTPAEGCQQQWIWCYAWVYDSQTGCRVVCLRAALVHQIVCSKLSAPGQSVPTTGLLLFSISFGKTMMVPQCSCTCCLNDHYSPKGGKVVHDFLVVGRTLLCFAVRIYPSSFGNVLHVHPSFCDGLYLLHLGKGAQQAFLLRVRGGGFYCCNVGRLWDRHPLDISSCTLEINFRSVGAL